MKLIAELKRRKVIRVAALYVGATWALAQGISQLTPALDLPDSATRWFLILAAVGFVIVLALLWFFEITPHGIQLDPGPAPSVPEPAQEPLADDIPHNSIAVLPFVDMSSTQDQGYFSDGVAEEILNALVRLKDLKVAGRTSSFSFKGRNEDLRTIGRTLAVAHVLEGSVRKHGERMRITAQLIQTCDGYHLWSENFDGDLSDVFDLQERIARAVASQFDVILHGDQRLVPVATTNPEAYRLYLQASDIYNRRDMLHIAEAIELLKQSIALDPGFARAHSRLAAVYALETSYSPDALDTALANVTAAATRASALDPGLGEPYSAFALTYAGMGRYIEAREAMEQSLRVQPESVAVRYWVGSPAILLGYVDWGCTHLDHLLELDPLYPAAMLWRGVGHLVKGEPDSAEKLFRKASDLGLAHVGLGLHVIMAARGQIEEAIAQLTRGLTMLAGGLSGEQLAILAQGVYGDTAAHARMDELIDRILASQPRWLPAAIPYVLLVRGETPRAMDIGMRFRTAMAMLYFPRFWMPSMRSLRRTPEFRAFVRHVGLTALWDRYGPPDGASRNEAGDYVWD